MAKEITVAFLHLARSSWEERVEAARATVELDGEQVEGGMDSDSAIQDNNLQDTVQDSEPGKTRMKDKTGKHSCMYFFDVFFFMSMG